MKIERLWLRFLPDGKCVADVAVECRTGDEVQALIAWLELAQRAMVEWSDAHAKTLPPLTQDQT
jgi:hypothetical protein